MIGGDKMYAILMYFERMPVFMQLFGCWFFSLAHIFAQVHYARNAAVGEALPLLVRQGVPQDLRCEVGFDGIPFGL